MITDALRKLQRLASRRVQGVHEPYRRELLERLIGDIEQVCRWLADPNSDRVVVYGEVYRIMILAGDAGLYDEPDGSDRKNSRRCSD